MSGNFKVKMNPFQNCSSEMVIQMNLTDIFVPRLQSLLLALQIIDDSEYETMEQFEILLTSPSLMSRIGPQSQAIAIIEGPNDGKIYMHFFI